MTVRSDLYPDLLRAVRATVVARGRLGIQDSTSAVISVLFVLCNKLDGRASIRVAARALLQWCCDDPELARAALEDAVGQMRRGR